MTAFTPKTLTDELIHHLQRGIAPMVTSSPGVGKSSIARKVAASLNLELIDTRLITYMPEDLNGYLNKTQQPDGTWIAEFLPVNTFPLEDATVPEGKSGWLIFLDELSSASKATQAAAYRLILDREVGARPLHESVAIMGAGNSLADRAVVTQMSTALVSRMSQLTLEVSANDFIEFAYANGLDRRVIAYIAYQREAHLMNFDPKIEGPYACPRTWEMCSDLVFDEDVNASSLARIQSVIGSRIAPQFITFCQQYDKMPSYNQIVTNPEMSPPSEMATKFAVAVMLSEQIEVPDVGKVLEYLKNFPLDLQLVFIRGTRILHPHLEDESNVFLEKIVSLVRYLSS